jgi:hypothetical protein
MKIQNRLAILTVTAITSMFITQAQAQYQPVGEDGITASPKVRAMVNERARSASAPIVADVAAYPAPAGMDIAASPKVRQLLSEQKARATAPAVAVVAVSQPRTTGDGIAASPKVRAQLNERSNREVQVAPLK